MSAFSQEETFRLTAISRCYPWFLISILTAKLGAEISGVATNGYKRRHKGAITPIESGLGWHLVWVESIAPGRVPAFEFGSRAEGPPTWEMSAKGKEARDNEKRLFCNTCLHVAVW